MVNNMQGVKIVSTIYLSTWNFSIRLRPDELSNLLRLFLTCFNINIIDQNSDSEDEDPRFSIRVNINNCLLKFEIVNVEGTNKIIFTRLKGDVIRACNIFQCLKEYLIHRNAIAI